MFNSIVCEFISILLVNWSVRLVYQWCLQTFKFGFIAVQQTQNIMFTRTLLVQCPCFILLFLSTKWS